MEIFYFAAAPLIFRGASTAHGEAKRTAAGGVSEMARNDWNIFIFRFGGRSAANGTFVVLFLYVFLYMRKYTKNFSFRWPQN